MGPACGEKAAATVRLKAMLQRLTGHQTTNWGTAAKVRANVWLHEASASPHPDDGQVGAADGLLLPFSRPGKGTMYADLNAI